MTEPTPSDNPFAGPPPVPPITDIPDKDARTWAMLCHLSALAQFAVPSFGQIVGPLVVWLVKKNDHPFIDEQGKESLNFQISITIYAVVASLLLVATCLGAILVVIPAIGFVVMSVVYCVLGALAANKGQHYRYPLTIRFFK
jgi:uncharacterized Tic20 family protein